MKDIKHQGKIIKVSPQHLSVQISSLSACMQCEVRKSCGMMESKDKIIEIEVPAFSNYEIGQDVVLGMSLNSGFIAVFWGYVLPLILVLVTLFIAIGSGFSELISGLSSIIILIPYYFGLFLGHKYFNKQFKFKIIQD